MMTPRSVTTDSGTVLVEQPDGTWAEQFPSYLCPLDQPLRRYLVGWLPCRCGGHRTVRCEEDHGHTEDDRTKYHPPLVEGCAAPVVRGVGDDVPAGP